jgi:hypothetical protein
MANSILKALQEKHVISNICTYNRKHPFFSKSNFRINVFASAIYFWPSILQLKLVLINPLINSLRTDVFLEKFRKYIFPENGNG